MTSAAPAGYVPPYMSASNNAPIMMLPTHVDGIIDLKTLTDIHRYLCQSELDDDQELGAWVKENYLYEPMLEPGRKIQTTEGFSKLDRAYRRVRSLTNKAQDKWPFFDRAWKAMPSMTVKNNARGEAAPGVSFPGMNVDAERSPISNERPTSKRESHCVSPTPKRTFNQS
jgi:hypothetical protein